MTSVPTLSAAEVSQFRAALKVAAHRLRCDFAPRLRKLGLEHEARKVSAWGNQLAKMHRDVREGVTTELFIRAPDSEGE